MRTAFRAIARAKKEGLPFPAQAASVPSAPTTKSLSKGKQRAAEVEETNGDAEMDGSEPEYLGALSEADAEAAAASGEEDGDDEEGNVTRLSDDRDDVEEEDLPLADEDIEDDEAEEEDEDEDDSEGDEEEEPENPDNYDDEMGVALDGKRARQDGGAAIEADET